MRLEAYELLWYRVNSNMAYSSKPMNQNMLTDS